jgi:hypothetical protein
LLKFTQFIEDEELTEAARRSLSRMSDHMQGRSLGMISAVRKERTPEENNKHTDELENHLKGSGFGYMARKGKYMYDDGKVGSEKSFIVMSRHKGDDQGALHHFLSQHGAAHGQESIVHKAHDSPEAHLHFLQDTSDNKKGDSFSIGPFRPNHANPYGHTVLSEPGKPKVDKTGNTKTAAANKVFSFAPRD